MTKKTLDILLLEDSDSDAELLQNMLKNNDEFTAHVHWVTNLAEAKNAIASNSYSLIMADLCLPDSRGIATVSGLKNVVQETPIIALTSGILDVGIDAIRAGAHDFIPKNQISVPFLGRTVLYTIERFRMTEELITAYRSNEHLKNMFEISQQFVDNVSHEFRTPLTVIKEFASIVRDGIDGPVTEKQEARLSTLITRTNDLALMVDDLLDTSKLESGLLRACRKEHNLKSIVSHVEKMLQPRALARKIKLTMVDVADDLFIFCDEEKLRRILINLIVNAIKFTPSQGEVEILAEVADHNQIKITVSDNGNGISRDDLNLIFQRFQQVGDHARMSSCKGFGLGLSIARSLASLNLGSLEVSSEPGEGSQFSVFVPIARTDAILNCYFDQREATRIGEGEISIIEVRPNSISSEDAEEVNERIDDFLLSNTKHFDLTLQTDTGHWLLIACVGKKLLPNMLSRLVDEWQTIDRNHHGIKLPSLSFQCTQTMMLDGNREQLMNLIAGKPAVARAIPPEVQSEMPARKRLLIVDDEVEIVSAMKARFTASGFDVVTTFDGEAGIEAARAIEPDAILMDIRMPKIDGLKALEILKSDPSTDKIPVIVLSACLHDQKLALDRGASFFIQKPFDSKSIFSALKTVFLSLKPDNQQQTHCDTQTEEIRSPKFLPQTPRTNTCVEDFQSPLSS